MSYMPSTSAMNSEFQKPEDVTDEDVYATPAEEDTGETIVEQQANDITTTPSPSDTQAVTPSQTVQTPAENVTSSEAEAVTTEQVQTPTEQQQQATTEQQQQQDIIEETPPTEQVEITPITSPSDGNSSDVVIEETSNFWLLAIAGAGILIVIVAILFQRLRNNNPYDR